MYKGTKTKSSYITKKTEDHLMNKIKSNKTHIHSDKENISYTINTRVNTMPINNTKGRPGKAIDPEQRLNNNIENKFHNKKNTLKIDMLVGNGNEELVYKPKTYSTMITRDAQRKINSPFISNNTKNRMNEIVNMNVRDTATEKHNK